jgi:MarR family transcriptional regulator, organic hydroperoxide resistance regulator
VSTSTSTHADAGSATAGPAGREAWGLISRIFLGDKGRRFAIMNELGLTWMQGMALISLDEPRPMSDLAVRMHCDSSNITGIADRLTALGLAERRPSTNDRRIKTLELTAKGRQLRAKVADRMGEPPVGFAALSESEAQELAKLLGKVADAQA